MYLATTYAILQQNQGKINNLKIKENKKRISKN